MVALEISSWPNTKKGCISFQQTKVAICFACRLLSAVALGREGLTSVFSEPKGLWGVLEGSWRQELPKKKLQNRRDRCLIAKVGFRCSAEGVVRISGAHWVLDGIALAWSVFRESSEGPASPDLRQWHPYVRWMGWCQL